MKKIRVANAFSRRAKKLLKRNPQLHEKFKDVVRRLSSDPFDPMLHSHSLAGILKGRYSCHLTSDLRIIFKLHDDILHLLDIGSHDEVY